MTTLITHSNEPEVGMGATVCLFTDRHAATIVEVLRNARGAAIAVAAQQDKAIRIDGNGMSDAQSYRYEADPDGRIMWFTLRIDRWVAKGQATHDGTSLSIGHRSEYFDYSY
jgi:hypothetical protein